MTHRGPSVHHDRPVDRAVDELPGLVVDLEGEFPGGRDDEDLGALAVVLTGSRNILLDETSYGGQQKCRLQRERERERERTLIKKTFVNKSDFMQWFLYSKFTDTPRAMI